MKKQLPIFAFLVGLLLSASAFVSAQAQGNSRALYYDYRPASPASHKPSKPPRPVVRRGRPGVRFWLVQEQDGAAAVVSPKSVFREGDRVKLRFTANYPAYIAIFNEGSSGRTRLLYPFAGQSRRLTPNVRQAIPQGKIWFKFDQTPGVERLTVLMSSQPFADLDQLVARFKTRGGTRDLETVVLDDEGDTPSSSNRDLTLDFVGNEGYALAAEEALTKVKAFRFTLKHE